MKEKLRIWLSNFTCDRLDWHNPMVDVRFDGCSYLSYCRHCGCRIMLDSRGNWVSVGGREEK